MRENGVKNFQSLFFLAVGILFSRVLQWNNVKISNIRFWNNVAGIFGSVLKQFTPLVASTRSDRRYRVGYLLFFFWKDELKPEISQQYADALPRGRWCTKKFVGLRRLQRQRFPAFILQMANSRRRRTMNARVVCRVLSRPPLIATLTTTSRPLLRGESWLTP